MKINKENDCKNCEGSCVCHKGKALKITLVLLVGVGIGAVVGVKYHKELTKAALDSWNLAQSNSKKYAHLSEKQLKSLKKDVQKKLKNR